MKLSEIITNYRQEHGLSQRQFATKCGLSNGYIAMLEKESNPKTGKPIIPTLASLNQLAEGLGMTMTELFTVADDMPISIMDGFNNMVFKESTALNEECGLDDKLDMALLEVISYLTVEEKIDLYEKLTSIVSDRNKLFIPISENDRQLIRYIYKASPEMKSFLISFLQTIASKNPESLPAALRSIGETKS